ncbi:hypothetical protein B0H13DRAFT_1979015, partial [Mycena leptocephala]
PGPPSLLSLSLSHTTSTPRTRYSNYWTWKDEAEASLLADGFFDTVDPFVPMPSGCVQMHNWVNKNQKAYGILYSMLSPLVQAKVDNVGVMNSGCLLWAQLAAFYPAPTPDPVNLIPVSLPISMDQNKPPPCSAPVTITVINGPDLQQGDSAINPVRSGPVTFPNHGGEHPEALATFATGFANMDSHHLPVMDHSSCEHILQLCTVPYSGPAPASIVTVKKRKKKKRRIPRRGHKSQCVTYPNI